jgi:hypothetical protein
VAQIKKDRQLETKKKTHLQSEDADEYETFSNALKKVLTVSHDEIQKKIKHNASRGATAKP